MSIWGLHLDWLGALEWFRPSALIGQLMTALLGWLP